MTAAGFLADTHIVLWSIADDPRLSALYREILASDAVVFVSAASVWEMSIKRSLGKLDVPDNLAELLPQMRFTPLAITAEHAQAVATLPLHHSDPFDRLLIAQARLEGLTIMTADPQFPAYGVAVA